MLPRLRKPLRWSLGVVIGLLVLLAAVVAIGERLIDTPKVRAQLTGKFSQVMNGQVSWEKLDIRLLPAPHAEIRRVHVAIPKLLTMDVGLAQAKIRLLPLFRGDAEVQAITLEHPSVDISIAAASKEDAQEKSSQPATPLALYRRVMRPALDAIGRFAPATTVAIEDGRVACHLSGLQPFEARELNVRILTDGKGIALDASATGTYWERVAINGRVEFADLRALVRVEGSELKLQPALEDVSKKMRESLALSDAGAKLEVGTDGHTDINITLGLELPKAAIRVHGRQLAIGPVRIAGTVKFIEDDIAVALNAIRLGELVNTATANLMLTGAERAPQLDIAISELDVAHLRDAALILVAGRPSIEEYLTRIHAGRMRDLHFATQADRFGELFALSHLHASVQLVAARMAVPILEREATDITAGAELTNGVIKVSALGARLGASQLRQVELSLSLLKPMRVERTRGRVTIVLQDLLPPLRARKPFAKFLRSVPALSGVAEADVRNLALRFDKPSRLAYDLSVSPRPLRIDSDKLPDVVSVRGGAVRITPKSISADRVGIEALGARATASGELSGLQDGQLHATARITQGLISTKLIDWLWLRAALAERLKPTKPLNFAAQRVQWSKAGLDVVADASINAGPSLNVELSKRDKTFTLRRATIRDHDSDATISFAMHDSLIDAGFSGVLAARSLALVLGRSPESYPGRMNGNIQATLDLGRQRRGAARGRLTGANVDLLSLTGKPLKLTRFELQGDGNALQIHELTLDWAEQKATIRGTVERDTDGIEARLQIDSPGIVIDALQGTPAAKAASTSADKKKAAPAPSKSSNLWSVPVTGTASLRTNFVEYRGYRVQDIRAVAALEHEAASVNVTEASLCGISFPLTLQITPKQFDANVSVTAKDQTLEGVVQCLTGTPVIMTGQFNLASMLSAQGAPDRISESLAKHLVGSIEFSARDGEIRKMALLGNILALKSVRDLLKGDVGLGEHGFKYRSIALGAKIANGEMTLEQGALDSPALGLAAAGTVNLENYDSRLTVLVAPFGKLDRMVRNIPILGYVIGGAFTSIPVGISGDIRKPIVAPLGPRAVGSEVMGVFERTFKLPGKMVEPLSAKPSK